MARYGNISKTKKLKRRETKVKPILFPISHYKEEAKNDSIIFAYMFPAEGTLRDVTLVVTKMSTSHVNISIETEKNNIRLTKTVTEITVGKGVNTVDNIKVDSGDRVKVMLKNNVENVQVENLWISFFYQYGGENV